jgi:hypothetical protein
MPFDKTGALLGPGEVPQDIDTVRRQLRSDEDVLPTELLL